MPPKREKLVQIKIRVSADLAERLDEFVYDGDWQSRSAMLRSIIEHVIHESNNHEELLT